MQRKLLITGQPRAALRYEPGVGPVHADFRMHLKFFTSKGRDRLVRSANGHTDILLLTFVRVAHTLSRAFAHLLIQHLFKLSCPFKVEAGGNTWLNSGCWRYNRNIGFLNDLSCDSGLVGRSASVQYRQYPNPKVGLPWVHCRWCAIRVQAADFSNRRRCKLGVVCADVLAQRVALLGI